MTRKPSSPKEIVRRCNDLARWFYAAHGCQVPKGYRFDLACHPPERSMWSLAVLAFDFIEGTDVKGALDQLD